MPDNTTFPDFDERDLEIIPIERSETIPSRWYTAPQMVDVDNDIIFSQTWQYVGTIAAVANPGNYITTTVAGNPVIIIRGKDNILRAFYNVCRHRGGPLALDEQGTCNVLQCKYHGWTYLLDGSLRGVPKFDRAELFDKKDFGLVPIEIDEWEGLLFVNLSAGKGITLPSVFKGIKERISPISLGQRKFARRILYQVNCNWKVYVDNYLEGYHLPLVHPELCNLLDYQQYITETFENYSLQFSPFTGKDNIYGNANGEAFYYFVFPNFMLNILPGRLQTNLVVPIAHNKTTVIFDYYYDDVSSPSAIKLIEDDIAYSDKIQQEDVEICERVQNGLESKAYDKGRFSVEMEQGVYHFQCLLKKEYSKTK
jgi:choline monooxygenase